MQSPSSQDNHSTVSQDTKDSVLLDGYAANIKGKTGIRRIIKAASYSKDGFIAAFHNEAAFRQVSFLNAFLLLVIIFVPFSFLTKMVLVFASFFSVIVELFNTGIEAAIDHTSTERHPLAKIAKDVGSAAQFLALLLLFILWIMAIVGQYV